MKLDPKKIAPSQDFLKPNTVRFISECIANGEPDKLPPAPIVRQDEAGNYVAIDGHNLIAVRAFRGEDIEVHIASNAQDGLPETSEENMTRNAELAEKFEQALLERDRVASEGILTFNDLILRNQFMFAGAEEGTERHE